MKPCNFHQSAVPANAEGRRSVNEHLEKGTGGLTNCISDRGRTLKRWSVRKVVGGIGAIVLIAAGVLYACNKDKQAEPANKITKSGALLVNPMKQWGVWHNECLEYMLSQQGAGELSADELWTRYGIPFFQEVLGDNYVDIPLEDINAVSAKVIGLIKARNTVSLIEELADKGKLNATFSSPYISRNNYTILHEFFSYMDNVRVNTEAEYWNIQTVVKNYEQEILTNYYSLLKNGELANDSLKDEYDDAMLCMAIAGSSGSYWYSYYINYPMGRYYAQIADYAATMGVPYTNRSKDIIPTKGLTATQVSHIAFLDNNYY